MRSHAGRHRAAPDGDPRLLDRSRQELGPGRSRDGHLRRSRGVPAQTRDDLDPVVEQPGALRIAAGLAAERAELSPEVDPEPHAEDQTATAEVIERDGFRARPSRGAERERGDEWTETDPRGRGGDGAERHPRVGQPYGRREGCQPSARRLQVSLRAGRSIERSTRLLSDRTKIGRGRFLDVHAERGRTPHAPASRRRSWSVATARQRRPGEA